MGTSGHIWPFGLNKSGSALSWRSAARTATERSRHRPPSPVVGLGCSLRSRVWAGEGGDRPIQRPLGAVRGAGGACAGAGASGGAGSKRPAWAADGACEDSIPVNCAASMSTGGDAGARRGEVSPPSAEARKWSGRGRSSVILWTPIPCPQAKPPRRRPTCASGSSQRRSLTRRSSESPPLSAAPAGAAAADELGQVSAGGGGREARACVVDARRSRPSTGPRDCPRHPHPAFVPIPLPWPLPRRQSGPPYRGSGRRGGG